jgi:hypothetical protein
MKTKLIYISLISCSILLSCEKDKQLIIENTDMPLLTAVKDGGELFLEYTYNEANLISEEKSKFHYTKHNYTDKNLLTTSDFYLDAAMFSSNSRVVEASMNRKEWVNPGNTEKSLRITFEYDDNDQVIKSIYYRASASHSEFSEFIYENERIRRQSMYWENILSGYIDYFYDENGNLIKQVKYNVSAEGIAELMTTTDFEYDNMKNPYKSFRRLMTPGVYTNENNIVKQTYTLHFEVDPSTEKVQLTETSYDYNDKGYPVRVNGTVEYVYK